MYCKDHLPLALRIDVTTLDDCLVCEIQNESKCFSLTLLYRFQVKSLSNFLCLNKGERKQSLLLIILIIAFLLLQCILEISVPELMGWWNGDSTNLQGTELAELAAQYSLK